MNDVFLCHSTDDKIKYIMPLVKKLQNEDITYWLDEAEIKLGDVIAQKIEEGLKVSKFVIVFISKNFIKSKYANRELYAILNQELSTGDVKVILILLDEQALEFISDKPLLQNKKYLKWSDGIETIVKHLKIRLNKQKKAMEKPVNQHWEKTRKHLLSRLGTYGGMLILLENRQFNEQLDLSLHNNLAILLMEKHNIVIKEQDRAQALKKLSNILDPKNQEYNAEFSEKISQELEKAGYSLNELIHILYQLNYIIETSKESHIQSRILFSNLINDLYEICLKIYSIGESRLKSRIRNIAASGEGRKVEFKSTLVYDLNQKQKNVEMKIAIAKTIAAFLNTSGGTLLIGVDNHGNPIGLDYDLSLLFSKDSFENTFSEIIVNMIGSEHNNYIKSQFEKFNSCDIYYVDVNKSNKPVFVTSKKGVDFYIRICNTTRSLNVREAIEYYKKTWDRNL